MNDFELLVTVLCILHFGLFLLWFGVSKNLLGPFGIAHGSFSLIYALILYPVVESRYGIRNETYFEAFRIFSSIGGILGVTSVVLLFKEAKQKTRRTFFDLSPRVDRIFLASTIVACAFTVAGLLHSTKMMGGIPLLVKADPSEFDLSDEQSLSTFFYIAVALNRACSALYAAILAFSNRNIFARQNRLGCTFLAISSIISIGGGFRSHLLMNFVIILFGAARRIQGARLIQAVGCIGGLLTFVLIGNLRMGSVYKITDNLNVSTGLQITDDTLAWIANYHQPNLPNFATRIAMTTSYDNGYNLLISVVPGAILKRLPIDYFEFIDAKRQFEKEFNTKLDARGMNFTTSMASYYADFGPFGGVVAQSLILILVGFSYFQSFKSITWFMVFCSNIPGILFICDVDFFLGLMSAVSIVAVLIIGRLCESLARERN